MLKLQDVGAAMLLSWVTLTLPVILPHQNPHQLWKVLPELTWLNRLGRSTWRMLGLGVVSYGEDQAKTELGIV